VSKRQNVVFIICHDISRRFGCYGNPQVHTPNIDKLAERGVVFGKHYCHYPLCGPSRANIFTGYRPEGTQRWHNDSFFPEFRQRMGDKCVTLPQHLRDHGYYTQPFNQVYHGAEPDPPSWDVPAWRPALPPVPDWATPEAGRLMAPWVTDDSHALMRERAAKLMAQGLDLVSSKNVSKRWRGPAVEAADVPDGAYREGMVTEKAVERLVQLTEQQGAFFLGVGYGIGHLPWCSPRRYWDLYSRASLTLPESMTPPKGAFDLGFGTNEPGQYYTQDLYDKPWWATPQQAAELLHGAYAAISFFDAQVGKLLNVLDTRHLWDDTIVILTTDHGFSLGEHGQWGKHWGLEQPTSVPLIISAPGYRTGRHTAALTEHVDIYPTLCDLLDLPKPDFLEGTSLVPLLEDPARPWKKAVFAARHGGAAAWLDQRHGIFAKSVRSARYRFNLYRDECGQEIGTELYDYESDPQGSVNLAGRIEHEEVEKEMRALLTAGWRGEGTRR